MTIDLRFSRRRLVGGAAASAAAAALGTRPRPTSAEEARAIQIITPAPLRDPASYAAYVPAICKAGQWFHYTCEFDAAWAVLKTFGVDATLQQQLDAVGVDTSVEPTYEERSDGVFIYGGDISKAFSGSYLDNFLARTTGKAFRKVFTAFDLPVRAVHTREEIERSLRRQRLIWIKTTVDFKDWVPATWVASNGKTFPAVLGNDHAVIVMGYDQDVVLIRDVLGPTSTNWERPYEYEVPWDRFLACWAAQGSDGLAVGE